VQLHRARDEFDAAGVNLVLIGQATPRDAARFRGKMDIDLPVLADEHRVSYKAIGAKKGSVGELVGPRMLAKGILTSARTGAVQGRTVGNTTQLGGAIVVLPGGKVAWAHLAKDASDNASPQDLLAAARKAS
jgi:hypothetical protein